MNITESVLVAAIVLAISGTVFYVGSKVMGQVEAQTSFMETISDPQADARIVEQVARVEADRRLRLAEQAAKAN